MDGDILNEIIIPTTNVDRLLPDGSRQPDELVNKSQTFITTAGWKNSFPYNRLIDMLINSVIDPKNYCILGGTFATPVKEGLLDKDFVKKLRLESTFNDSSFDREYKCISVLFKLLRTAGKLLEIFLLQHKNEISLSANV